MVHQVWLIGGTSESRAIAQVLMQNQIPCVITVTTEAARQLYPIAESLTVQVGALSQGELPAFLRTYGVGAIVDASHPHAVEISQNAIHVAHKLQLPYLRYERPVVSHPSVRTLPDWETLLEGDYLTNQRVLLIVGYRMLHRFVPWHDRATLFVRLLPSLTAIAAAQNAGFDNRRIIALRPPITPELEAALWQQWQISLVVAKSSGTAGGEDVKQQVAEQRQVPLILIARPPITYPQQTQDLRRIVEFCTHHLH